MSENDSTTLEFSMLRSRYIAGLIGPMLLAIAVSLLINRGLVAEIAAEVTRDKALIFMSGLLLLVAGLAIIQLHPGWRGWPAIITVIGWLSVVSGLARVLFPFELAELIPTIITGPAPQITALVCGVLGGFLTLKAYF